MSKLLTQHVCVLVNRLHLQLNQVKEDPKIPKSNKNNTS